MISFLTKILWRYKGFAGKVHPRVKKKKNGKKIHQLPAVLVATRASRFSWRKSERWTTKRERERKNGLEDTEREFERTEGAACQ